MFSINIYFSKNTLESLCRVNRLARGNGIAIKSYTPLKLRFFIGESINMTWRLKRTSQDFRSNVIESLIVIAIFTFVESLQMFFKWLVLLIVFSSLSFLNVSPNMYNHKHDSLQRLVESIKHRQNCFHRLSS